VYDEVEVADWLLRELRRAWTLAKVERLNELREVHVRRFDAQGMHPWSQAWGFIEAYWAVLDLPMDEGLLPSAEMMRQEARKDAQGEYEAELRAQGQETLPLEDLEAPTL